ncbi:hypothetical protein HELRODRAFT_116840 [Helobdella robusta]|uniref:Golgi apparatus protein 1 n=1 Tax=Helobdella robusta TaxID=6412 RepID=T1EGI3_HELRO|nr:hypothetical protein HELRODRAFT_116840 [Helobdella robusta]ESO11293.1 hypothetical protein HELRODRAFT_116840 [Helobdella robusta]
MNKNPEDPYNLNLAKSLECAGDVGRICGRHFAWDNFQVISCLQNGYRDNEISEPCQHLIWNYKRNMTVDPVYEKMVQNMCQTMIAQIPECKSLTNTKGHLIPCLIGYLDNSSLTTPHCQSFLSRLKPVVFGDYRIIYKFSESCQADITRLKCGRVEGQQEEDAYHNQGNTLTCLEKKLSDLQPNCRDELLRVAELQADDYHNDRWQLYFACRNDRERLCGDVQSGQGRVYECLFKKKMSPDMSEKCRDMLILRQRLQQEDYKVNLRLAQSCQEEVVENNCMRHIDRIARFPNARMSAILLCLEAGMKEGRQVKAECRMELKEVRRSMMEDYRISPSIVVGCSNEIEQKCGGSLRRDGGTIHCLMDLARPQKVNGVFSIQVSSTYLMLQVDIGESYDVDPILKRACRDVVAVYCGDLTPGEGRVMQCLMSSIDKPQMTEVCRESLTEIQYFISRDFRLDPQLYKECHKEASTICRAPSEWYNSENVFHQPEIAYLIFACLYRHIDREADPEEKNYKPLSRKCAIEVERVMRERALSVNLDPIIEGQCLNDLSKFCLDKSEKSEEMNCLEDNLDNLSEECRKVVSESIVDVDKDPSINGIFLRSCEPFWQKHCQMMTEELEDELMACLILNKHHPDMHDKCRAGVEHHQLMTLKDYKFSHNFDKACRSNIKKYCPQVRNKADVVDCLSTVMLTDTFLETKHRLDKQCRAQLNFEFLQRSEDILLDPKLRDSCSKDISTFCQHVEHGEQKVIQCLMDNFEKLSQKCHREMFRRKEIEAVNPKHDYGFVTKCQHMIQKHCSDQQQNPHSIIYCLLQKMNDEDDDDDGGDGGGDPGDGEFDEKCKRTVAKWSHVMGIDIRLDRELSVSCSPDIRKHCPSEFSSLKNDSEDGGKVLECLKNVYVKKSEKPQLTARCHHHIRNLIRMEAKDHRMNIPLVKHCHAEIKNLCSEEANLGRSNGEPDGQRGDEGEADNGRVLDCLKDAVLKKLITMEKNRKCFKQISHVIEEDMVDIHADVRLYSACSLDLVRLCGDVPLGEGKKLECLLAFQKDKTHKLSEKCDEQLKTRFKLWSSMSQIIQPPINLQEVFDAMTSSPSSHYFLFVFVAAVLVIFIFGLCFGRVTKRVRREMKNR